MLARSTLIPLLSCALLLSLAPAYGDGDHGAGATHEHKPVGQGRYKLIGYEPGQGVEVLDRATAILFLVDLRAREATALDGARGTIVTQKLVTKTIATPSAELAWPASGPSQSRRFEHVRGNALMRGASTALFDSDRGQLIVLTSGSRSVIDAPKGVHSQQRLQLKDGTGTLSKLEAGRNQRRAIMVLRTIAQAEGLFRRRNPEVRFASLAELLEAKILTKEAVAVPGYTIEVQAGKGELAQRRFLARATPLKPGLAHLAINETGVPHGSATPIPASDDASLPSHARPIKAPQAARRGQPGRGQPGRGQPGQPGRGQQPGRRPGQPGGGY